MSETIMSDFRLTQLIEKKRNGQVLTDDDINHFVDSVVKTIKPNDAFIVGKRSDRSQIGAMLMAIYFKGLDANETTALTLKMRDSGYIFSWPEKWKHLVVDKHSTGGVGDKISLILAPALSALGLKVPMISGRSLGHTGGTLDKLESIPGFRVQLSKEEIYNAVETVGCCIAGQTDDCVPADKVLYHCREITATVTCPPLIVASIVSKKLSEATNVLVYDVKYGKGSVFSSKEEALSTAKNLVKTSIDTKAVALLTSMENPLGKSIGNSLEVLEAIKTLQGFGPPDVLDLTCALGSEILQQVQNASEDEGENILLNVIKNGQALQKFYDMLIQQGVDEETAKVVSYGDAIRILPKASLETEFFYYGKEGYIQEIDPLILAKVWKEELFRSNQHPGVGITLMKVVGDKIETGVAWVKVHHQSELPVEVHDLLKTAVLVDSHQKKRILVDQKVYNTE